MGDGGARPVLQNVLESLPDKIAEEEQDRVADQRRLERAEIVARDNLIQYLTGNREHQPEKNVRDQFCGHGLLSALSFRQDSACFMLDRVDGIIDQPALYGAYPRWRRCAKTPKPRATTSMSKSLTVQAERWKRLLNSRITGASYGFKRNR